MQLHKALYGTLQAALLFWRLLSDTLIEWGFTLNPYDQYVANKLINGKQCTVVWHVDNLKISHMEEDLVEEMLKILDNKFGKDSLLTLTRAKVIEYLGMALDYSRKGKLRMCMFK